MIYLSVEKLSKNFPDQPLFDDLTFGIFKGEKVALIANNGAGKSSLIKILAGTDEADSGVVVFKEGLRVGVLDQDPSFDPELTIQQAIDTALADVRNLISAYNAVLESNDGSEQSAELLARLSTQMEVRKAWDYDRTLKAYLTRFNIGDLGRKISQLSGGEKKRVALALTLSKHPEMVILDEPTNHLDITMIEWLEDYLSTTSITLLMVTHDRYFLDRVCNHILELHQGKMYKHKGKYAYFLEKRAERESIFQREIDKASSLLKGELEWMRKTPQARTTKAKSRINAFYSLEKKANSGSREQSLQFSIKMYRLGGKILELKHVSKSYTGRKIINSFTYTFKKGDRVGIVGPNGAGKSSLLNMMTGQLKPDSGKINIGDTVAFGYYTQSGITYKEDQRIIDFVKGIAEYIPLATGVKLSASQFLQHFMFTPDMQYKPISKLSGGERRRLHLLTVLIKNPNFLILDEPTNDLDILTLNKLEEFLLGFNGVLVLVSHDRYFMDKLVDHLFIFTEDGAIKDYNGTYTEYRLTEKARTQEVASAEVKPQEHLLKSKLRKQEKNELRKLEREIDKLETEKSELETKLGTGLSDIDEITSVSTRIGRIVELIEEKTARWMVLAENF